MKIIYKSEGLGMKDIIALTKNHDIKKMSDAQGETLEFDKVVMYEDVNSKGEDMTVMAVQTKEGVKYATNSGVFIRNYQEIMAIAEESGEEIPTVFKVGNGTSKAGRPFITCDVVV